MKLKICLEHRWRSTQYSDVEECRNCEKRRTIEFRHTDTPKRPKYVCFICREISRENRRCSMLHPMFYLRADQYLPPKTNDGRWKQLEKEVMRDIKKQRERLAFSWGAELIKRWTTSK